LLVVARMLAAITAETGCLGKTSPAQRYLMHINTGQRCTLSVQDRPRAL
jgi:hypothetical protein